MRCEIEIDGGEFAIDIEGEASWGEDAVLFNLNDSDSVIRNMPWKDTGYGIHPLFDEGESKRLVEGTESLLREILSDVGIAIDRDFALERYHQYATTQELHQKVIERTRELTPGDFPFQLSIIIERMSKLLGFPLQAEIPSIQHAVVILRISRPNSADINPPHRDGYLDIYQHVINMWIPVVGCNELSSLPVLPGSHLWNEKDVLRTEVRGASINGLTYNVPGIIETKHGLKMIRANPQLGEVLVFTPFLIHGSAVNCNKDITRMSLELRLFNQEMLDKFEVA